MVETVCSHCGWRNEPGARMCGGCGRPLRAAGMVGATAAPTRFSSGDDMPTVADLPPVARSRRRAQPVAAEWGPAPEWAPRWGGAASKVLLILLIVALLVVLGGAGAWAAFIRPQLHQQVESALRAQLDAMVATVNQQPAIPTTTMSITAAQVTQTLQQQAPSQVPIEDLHVSFSGGRVMVSFTTDGFDGAVSTAFSIQNGRLVASATEVDGPLALIESGSEMEVAINGSLAKLRSDISVKQVTLDKDVMSVSIKGTV